MNRLTADARSRVISCLLEGCSIRSTVRLTGVAKKTVMRLLVEAGEACAAYQDLMFHDLESRRVQLDELWTFAYCKERNITREIAEEHPDAGDVWLWVAMCADSRLVLSWRVGQRDSRTARAFVADVASRLKNRAQVTTDGFGYYVPAIEESFGEDVDYAQQIKTFAADHNGRYSPPRFIGAKKVLIKGDPNEKHISTSYIERQNWGVRTTMRRYTRLSNGFSRKIRNHAAAVALNYFAYNFIKINRSLRLTPAMAANVVDRLYDVSDIVKLLEAAECKKAA
jgi:IS1 family transposase